MTDSRQPQEATRVPRWAVRPFGQVLGDLDLDPLARPQPVSAARVLAACLDGDTGAPAADELMAWPVSRRLQGLLAVTIATRGEHWVLTARCDAPSCGAPMDLPLGLDSFRRAADPARFDCTLPDGRTVNVSVPTGADQMAWLAAGSSEPGEIAARLVDQESADAAELSPEALAAIEEALEEADPLTTLSIETACPECGAAVSAPLDLERCCLGMLAAEQPRLIDDVHTLAMAYHWSEAQILAIPPERRRQYLERIDRMWS